MYCNYWIFDFECVCCWFFLNDFNIFAFYTCIMFIVILHCISESVLDYCNNVLHCTPHKWVFWYDYLNKVAMCFWWTFVILVLFIRKICCCWHDRILKKKQKNRYHVFMCGFPVNVKILWQKIKTCNDILTVYVSDLHLILYL